MRVRLDYYDHNESFGALLPVEATVEREPRASDSTHRWLLLRLDNSLEYKGVEYSHLLVASRWKDHSIGTTEATSVFVLLVPPPTQVADGFSTKSYPHVAWGMATVLAPNPAPQSDALRSALDAPTPSAPGRER